MITNDVKEKQLKIWKVKDNVYHVPVVYESYCEKYNDKDIFVLDEEHAKLLIENKINRQVTPHSVINGIKDYYSYSVDFIEELESIKNSWCAGGAQVVLGRFGLRLHFWEDNSDFVSIDK